MQVTTKKNGNQDCSLVSENKKTIWVKLTSDGNIIKRHRAKHQIIQ